ncbi:MAG: hypothetical protein H7A23_14115 [Leptospiraceae bacterium]|nr:hypothetical protein [Leptospiraceae bacterium]MCP5495685.1 hypothetical protein [Leptospiraceae bacterium]
MQNQFSFGLEAEFLLADEEKKRFLWIDDIDFFEIYALLESLPLDGIPPLDGLDMEKAHPKLMPYVVEGYHRKINDSVTMQVKGLEIRTPVCQSIKECLDVYEKLYQRLEEKIITSGRKLVSVSHHPYSFHFWGPQEERRADFWKWAIEVMTTYGPDINIRFPQSTSNAIFSNLDDFNAKLNYYAPALTAFTLSSPFCKGDFLINAKEQKCQSIRTFKRSPYAPTFESHMEEGERIEFKFFEMTPSLYDFNVYFDLCLVLGLSENLKGRALDQTRIYELGNICFEGVQLPGIKEKMKEVLLEGIRLLPKYGFESIRLERLLEDIEYFQNPSEKLFGMDFQKEQIWRYLETRSKMRSKPYIFSTQKNETDA